MKVLVIGGGASGLTAALTAWRTRTATSISPNGRRASRAGCWRPETAAAISQTGTPVALPRHGAAVLFRLRWKPSAWSRRCGSAPWAF